MDPFSVTSGVVGIVAFALQLAKAASKVKRAVEEVKSAPKEARELIERLVMLETTCQLIGFHLERRETLPGPSLSASPDIISKALAQCLVKIQDLEKMILSSSSSDSLSGTPRSKFDTASRLRLVLRKDKIGSLVHEIDRVISLLQFVIQVDMWAMTTTPLQSLLPSNHGSEPMGQSFQPEKSSNTTLLTRAPSQPIVSLNIRRATNQQSRTSRYLGCITWTIADGRIGDGDDVNSITYRKTSIAFRLPLTSSQLNFHYVGGMGTPSYALNVTHIIEGKTELSRRLWPLMSPGRDPRELHELISGRKLSIYSVIRDDSRELNLFFFAVAKRWADGCKYLLQHDFRHQFEQEEIPETIENIILSTFGQTCEITEMILPMRSHDMQEKDMKYLLETSHHPAYFNRYLKVFLNSPWINHTDLVSHAWKCVVTNIFLEPGSFYEPSSWIPSLRYLIEQGVDLHQPFGATCSTSYATILYFADHPFEADDWAYSWLGMLKACGVDLSSYIKVETTLIKTSGISRLAAAKNRKTTILDFEGLPMPSWRREVVMESNVVELLEEFCNLGPDTWERRQGGPRPSGPDDLKCWKAENIGAEWRQYCFPFLLSPINCITGLDDYRLDDVWSRKTYSRGVELRDQRFARRQAKKWRKAHPGEKPPSKKMPGTWVD